MAQTVLGVLNQPMKIVGPAQVLLVPYPAGGYAGATDALRITALKSLFYSDAATDADRVLAAGVSQWADLLADGVQVDPKPAPIEIDPNNGGKYTAAFGPASGTLEFTFHDLDANHMIDCWSALSSDTLTTAPGASIAGRKTVILGRQSQPLLVAVCVRYPSGVVSPSGVAEFGNIYLPQGTVEPGVIKIDKKSAASCKVKISGINDASLQGSMPMAPVLLWDQVTAAASS